MQLIAKAKAATLPGRLPSLDTLEIEFCILHAFTRYYQHH